MTQQMDTSFTLCSIKTDLNCLCSLMAGGKYKSSYSQINDEATGITGFDLDV
jgi:hypothetical protein